MDKELLFSIIKLCEQNNAQIRGIVCDMGNQRLLSQLNVYAQKSYFFVNPVDKKRQVYIFPDVPHCLKNFRNHTLDHNLILKQSEQNICLSKEVFEQLLISDDGDFRLCPKLSETHIHVKGNDRQRVRPATQLFSDTVSKALLFKFGGTYAEQSKIISIVDKWFDVMNSRTKYHWKSDKCGLGKISKYLYLRTCLLTA